MPYKNLSRKGRTMKTSKWEVGDKVIFVAHGVGCLGAVGTICDVENGRAAMQTRSGEKTSLWSDDSFEALSDDEWDGKVFINHPVKRVKYVGPSE